jgi:glycosyltransferase involved in cell wall biosynthesis
LALGRSFFQKNFAMTLRAWKSMGDARPVLSLFGFEPEIARDERVKYTSHPTDSQINDLYNEATIFVQTSRHEGFCLPILEAMAAGSPVITTDSHGNRDFCVNGVNCIMVDQDDSEQLATAMRRVLDDPDLQDRLRTAGLDTARHYTWRVVAGKLEAHYLSLF